MFKTIITVVKREEEDYKDKVGAFHFTFFANQIDWNSFQKQIPKNLIFVLIQFSIEFFDKKANKKKKR